MARLKSWIAAAAASGLALATMVACGAEDTTGRRIDAKGTGGSDTGTGATSGVGGSGGSATGGVPPIIELGGTGGDAGSAGGPSVRRPKVCDAAGNCTCMNMASIGKLARQGGTDAFIEWLNTKSSAHVDLHDTVKPELTKAFLDNLDVIIFQDLEGWTFTADEVTRLEEWVKGGGGIITLTGYGPNGTEAAPVNQLLAFSGIQYAGLSGAGDTGTTCANNMCYCWQDSVSFDVTGTHPIMADIQHLPALYGRSITAGDAEVVFQSGAQVLGAAKKVGDGKVFVFHDEWVTYTSQWRGDPVNDKCPNDNQYDQCWDQTAKVCLTANNQFQVAQFWYNAVSWVKPFTECDFVIKDPEVVIVIR